MTSMAECLLHPVILCALALWIVNDHLGKGLYPGWLTGKLSDMASLMVFPLLPIALHDLWSRRARRSAQRAAGLGFTLALGWIVATGLVMATINVWDTAADAYRWGLGIAQWPVRAILEWGVYGHAVPIVHPVRLTMDPSDLLTLPALAVPLALVLAVRRRTDFCS